MPYMLSPPTEVHEFDPMDKITDGENLAVRTVSHDPRTAKLRSRVRR
jgi:hypothetical protein